MNVEQAITDALAGIEVKDVKHGGRHSFNIHPVRVVGNDKSGKEAWGQISHQLRLRKDDQVHFRLVKPAGGKTSIERMDIKKGGLGRTLGISEEFSDHIGKEIDGSWEGAARDIIVRIASRI